MVDVKEIAGVDSDGRLICSDKTPYSPDRDGPGVRWTHVEAFEETDYGHTARYICPVCGIGFTSELPQ